MTPSLSVIVVNFNTVALTLECLTSVFAQNLSPKPKIWVVDNGSTDDSVSQIKKSFISVNIIENKNNLGFSKANNQAIKRADSDYVLLLNSDTKLLEDSLTTLVSVAVERDFDICSPKLLNSDRSIQPNGGHLPLGFPLLSWISGLDDLLGHFFFVPSYHQNQLDGYKITHQVGWVSGTAMLIKKEVFKKIGFLDENIFMYAEDVDFCFRAKENNLKVGFVAESEIIHIGGGSSNYPKFTQWRGEFLGLSYIYKKHFGMIGEWSFWLISHLFIIIRVIIFTVLGRLNYAKIYAKVFISF